MSKVKTYIILARKFMHICNLPTKRSLFTLKHRFRTTKSCYRTV